ncbi:hypothetical protein M422DRAFT_273845 [Sphaerobolus stellatus SS14]|uniref:Uncharacterized protein n=1 Tax=Sphaerobolus stellatus (strain SS14) TaxID=990650 RepID=A0A0C9UIX7_SPHS4|nr:hypothetical protein M422DRAFT_273845 [Sphaerobolus stellatus SS14]
MNTHSATKLFSNLTAPNLKILHIRGSQWELPEVELYTSLRHLFVSKNSSGQSSLQQLRINHMLVDGDMVATVFPILHNLWELHILSCNIIPSFFEALTLDQNLRRMGQGLCPKLTKLVIEERSKPHRQTPPPSSLQQAICDFIISQAIPDTRTTQNISVGFQWVDLLGYLANIEER